MIPEVQGRVWFITGCSSGFGWELAVLALRRGERVVATARQPDSLVALARENPERCLVLPLDVTNREQIGAAVAEAEEHFGGIDVLVNNAGRGFMVSIEAAREEDVRAAFELNFFGLVALTQAVLPGMRHRRRGHVVNISSTGGLVGRAGSGFYAATKFAVEGLSEALAEEVAPYGIRVTVVEPSAFRTRFATALRLGSTEGYENTAGARSQQVVQGAGKQAGDPARAAQAIMTAVDAPEPPLHLVLGNAAVDVARTKFNSFLREIDNWESVSRGVDFD